MSTHTNTTPAASSSSTLGEQPSLKRRRVAKACQHCRLQKSKCDGKHPVCGRCEGYGHACIWSRDKKDRMQGLDCGIPIAPVSEGPRSPASAKSLSPLHLAIQAYEELIKNIRLELSDSARINVDLTLSRIRRWLSADIVGLKAPYNISDTEIPKYYSQNLSAEGSANRQRYLGEASDVRFFHMIRKILRDEDLSGGVAENDVQSYDHGIPHLESQDDHVIHTYLPTRDLADTYINIYFFTIHIAYPFICKPSFMIRYEGFWKDNFEVNENSSWLPLMYTIFAIGAYYTSFPRLEKAEPQLHLQYFGQALSLSGSIMTNCTLENIQMLLAQCFFLLATGQSDRCWNTLGLAIRVAQSIGLHVEDRLSQPMTGSSLVEQETRRRTWYSLYVLDRLLALQLGRPVAIHEEECCVNLPSETAETTSLLDGEAHSFSLDGKPSFIDYFTSVINFSQILGQVISDLYRPSQLTIDPDRMLLSTTTLDEKLKEWKFNLPRHLRFDLGHTFEKSVIFRRQRNMLAIKFHHLRTLMHRPYLCLAWLQRHNRPLMALLERDYDCVKTLEKICVREAQQTAHLLHNVADERSLVYDFPWWQMISCLLCASSVLLVARSCIESTQTDARVLSQALNEDAETCLKVFDALSVNSDAAGRARDMMKGLKRTRILPQNPLISKPNSSSINETPAGNEFDVSIMHNLTNNTLDQSFNCGSKHTVPEWQTWPGELSDPMSWSAQFIDPSQNLHSNALPEAEMSLYALFEEDT